MTSFAFILIVLSAALHATWNLVAKKNHFTFAFYALMSLACTLFWSHVLFWTPIEISAIPFKLWGFIGASVASDVCLYCVGLTLTYRYMDMSTAYPVMRSLPILLTMLITAVLGLGQPLSVFAKLGCVVVFAGCMLMPMKKFSDFNWRNYLNISMLCVLLTACGTTGYTVFDKQALNIMKELYPALPGPTRSLTFYILRSCTLTSMLWIVCLAVPAYRSTLCGLIREHSWKPYFCGVCASTTYALVLWAMIYVDNVTYVQCFRQLGLPFGLLAGILFLKEASTGTKWVGVSLILAGLVLTVL